MLHNIERRCSKNGKYRRRTAGPSIVFSYEFKKSGKSESMRKNRRTSRRFLSDDTACRAPDGLYPVNSCKLARALRVDKRQLE